MLRLFAAAALLAVLAVPAQAREPMTLQDYLALGGPAPTARIAYGPAPLQYVELFTPEGRGPFPVAVLIHGGCFLNGFQGMKQMRGLAGALVAHGISVWSVEYRGLDTPGGGYPGTFEDIKSALDLLANRAAALHLDTRRLVMIGHSAGTYLALWAAGRAKLPPSSPLYEPHPLPIPEVVALGGSGDLRPGVPSFRAACALDLADLTGAPTAARPDVDADTTPAELIPNGSRTVFINGAQDDIATPEASAAYAARVRASGDAAETLVVPGASHYDEPAVGSRAWPYVLPAILAAVGVAGAT
jgi:acetyl esterase/lipase